MYHDKTITLTSCFNFTSGYRTILNCLLENLPFNIIPRSYTNIDNVLLKYFDHKFDYSTDILDLCLLPINNSLESSNVFLNLDFTRRRILYTMWESTRINDLLVEILNKFEAILVPNNYNKINFIKQGVTVPIHVIPLFCDTDIFTYQKKSKQSDKFIFGISNEDFRKNLNKVTQDFIVNFKNNPNVELQIKTQSELKIKYCLNNVKYINEKFTKKQLSDWYKQLNVYISGATCEGWGMMQQESMCCGTPVICTNYGGLSEFTNEQNSYYIRYKETYSTGYWDNCAGKWSEYDSNDLIDKMNHCVFHKDETIQKGKLASIDASKFTEKNFLSLLFNTLNQYI